MSGQTGVFLPQKWLVDGRKCDNRCGWIAFGTEMVKRISQRPQAILPKIIRSVYIRPRQTTVPVNIFEIGMEKPIEAYRLSVAEEVEIMLNVA